MSSASWKVGVGACALWMACGEAATPNADVPAAVSAAMQRCEAIGSAVKAWPDASTRVLSAVWHEAGTVRSFMGPQNVPAHCEVSLVMAERTGAGGQKYAIRFKVRLPEEWNRRLFFMGGGGTNGEVGDAIGMTAPGKPNPLERGYAVVSQDSGHDNRTNSVPEQGGVVAFGFDPQARANYGGASIKPVTEAARALINARYGSRPDKSYFSGCSKGGQEGMYAAQRYPELFDGIVAGAPGFSLPRAAVAEVWDTQAFASLLKAEDRKPGGDPMLLSGTFSDAQLARVRTAVLEACDADDGLKDGMTANWKQCTWSRVKPRLLQQVCSTSAECLSKQQVEVIGRVYGGPKDSKGRALYSDWPFDAGVGSADWRSWKIGSTKGGPMGPPGPSPSINVAMGAPALAAVFTTPPTALGPQLASAYQYALGFNFDRDAARVTATTAEFPRSAWEDIAARSTDLAAFRARGGKMIVPHGVSDPVFSFNDTAAWFGEVDRRNGGAAAQFIRVFGVPGMSHCAGGPATDHFNAFDALVDWVEQGKAPERLVATAGPASPWPHRTRPLCPLPKMARYDGMGDIEQAASFRCE